MQTTDEILLKAIENKDRKAFTQFYERYNRTVLCFVLSKVHNKDIAKDIADVNRSAQDMSKNSTTLDNKSRELFEISEKMKTTVRKFKI